MTENDILTMASESYCWRINLYSDRIASIARLQRFAKLVAAKEREACAKLIRGFEEDYDTDNEFSDAIRARGNHD